MPHRLQEFQRQQQGFAAYKQEIAIEGGDDEPGNFDAASGSTRLATTPVSPQAIGPPA